MMKIDDAIIKETGLDFIRGLVAKYGPDPEDYDTLDAWNLEMHARMRRGEVSEEERRQLVEILGDALSTETMQGFAFHKPHGYAGDFEIIDRIYTRYTSDREELRKWDVFWQQHPAAEAVRNRKELFCRMLDGLGDSPKSILNIASGPARDVHDWMAPGKPRHRITCLDMDPKAVEHAKGLVAEKRRTLNGSSPDIRFIDGNALRYRPKEKYDLIWSGGLFDYFSDRVFSHMVRKLSGMINPGGGNCGRKLRNLQPVPTLHGIRGAMGATTPKRKEATTARPRCRGAGGSYRYFAGGGGGEFVSAFVGAGSLRLR